MPWAHGDPLRHLGGVFHGARQLRPRWVRGGVVSKHRHRRRGEGCREGGGASAASRERAVGTQVARHGTPTAAVPSCADAVSYRPGCWSPRSRVKGCSQHRRWLR